MSSIFCTCDGSVNGPCLSCARASEAATSAIFEPVVRGGDLEQVVAMTEWEVTLRRDIAEVERAALALRLTVTSLQEKATIESAFVRAVRRCAPDETQVYGQDRSAELYEEARDLYAAFVDCERWLVRAKAALEPLGFLEFAS